jgi:soluble lytic murein transglycosylase-like protein
MGVMQLMPATAARNGVVDPFDPQDNARGAARYLRTLWDRYRGDKRRIAAAYNAGEGLVPRRGQLRVPTSTLGYAGQVVKLDRRKTPIDALTEPLVITADKP